MSLHRKPPYPESFTGKVEAGYCRWCEKPIDKALEPRQQCWHKACAKQFRIISFPDVAKRELLKLSRFCAHCGYEFITEAELKFCRGGKMEINGYVIKGHWGWANLSKIELDHKTPLAIAPRELKYWGLENLQLLCRECHKAKSALDIWLIKGKLPQARGVEESRQEILFEAVSA